MFFVFNNFIRANITWDIMSCCICEYKLFFYWNSIGGDRYINKTIIICMQSTISVQI
jgi:hypothetical protein